LGSSVQICALSVQLIASAIVRSAYRIGRCGAGMANSELYSCSSCLDVVFAGMLVFVLSGIASPMLIMQARFSFEPLAVTLWPLYPLYLGNLLAGAFSPKVSRDSWLDSTRLFGFDIGGQVCSNLGLLIVGPPLYAIFYKSVTVFTGLLSLCFLPPSSHPTRFQWCAMLVVTLGLFMGGADALALGAKELLGAVLVILGCLFYAGGAVASEFYLGIRRRSLQPLQAAWVMGVEGTALCAVWAAFTVRDLRFGPGFWILMLGLVLTNACHQATWFLLVGRVGACATAMLKAFQSACLFIAASAFFCRRDSLECLTWAKLGSFAIVSLGVMMYSYPQQRSSDECCRAPLIPHEAAVASSGTFAPPQVDVEQGREGQADSQRLA